MEKILFINACVRGEDSRTLVLAQEVLKPLQGEVRELRLENEPLLPLTRERLSQRDRAIADGAWEHPMFRYAREFAQADQIVIAAPFWDLGFPSLLKLYLETVMVSGIVFEYADGIPKGLCKAKRLSYVTTAGGPIFEDFGYPYVRALAKNFFGIPEVSCCRAENLDVDCIAPNELLEKATVTEMI